MYRQAFAAAALMMLCACSDPSAWPASGNRSSYQRGIDQDVSSSHQTGATVGNESRATPANWR